MFKFLFICWHCIKLICKFKQPEADANKGEVWLAEMAKSRQSELLPTKAKDFVFFGHIPSAATPASQGAGFRHSLFACGYASTQRSSNNAFIPYAGNLTIKHHHCKHDSYILENLAISSFYQTEKAEKNY